MMHNDVTIMRMQIMTVNIIVHGSPLDSNCVCDTFSPTFFNPLTEL